jgi:hypothetical protein
MEDIEALLQSGNNVNISKRQLSSLPAAFEKLASQFSKLDLSTNALVNLSSLTSCSALHWLDAHGNILTSLDGIGSCSALLVLNACHNRIADISPLQALTNLCSLVLSDNQIEDIKFLPIAPKLNNLVLSNNSIKKLPKSIGKLSSLQRLSLSKNKLSALPEFPFLGNLEQLRLNGNRFEAVPTCITQCRRLRLLDLGNNKIDDVAAALGVLRQISLRNLSLRGNPCAHSETYSSEVAAALPRLEVFDDKVTCRPSALLPVSHAAHCVCCRRRAKRKGNRSQTAMPELRLLAESRRSSGCSRLEASASPCCPRQAVNGAGVACGCGARALTAMRILWRQCVIPPVGCASFTHKCILSAAEARCSGGATIAGRCKKCAVFVAMKCTEWRRHTAGCNRAQAEISAAPNDGKRIVAKAAVARKACVCSLAPQPAHGRVWPACGAWYVVHSYAAPHPRGTGIGSRAMPATAVVYA